MTIFDSQKVKDLEQELKTIRHKLFGAKTKATKVKYRKRDEELRNEIAEELKRSGWGNKSAEQLAGWDPYDQNGVSPFFDPEWMFDVKDGFDVVIGNPPYIEHKKLKHIASTLKVHYKTYSGTADLYVYFYEQGIKCLKPKGILSIISSNKFIKTKYGLPLRAYFLEHQIQQLIDFTDIHVFDALVASCVLNVINRKIEGNNLLFTSCDDTIGQIGLRRFIKENPIMIPQENLSPELWLLENSKNAYIKSAIESKGKKLKDIAGVNVNRGVTTGYNPAFIIDKITRKKLIKADSNSKQIIKPLIQGRNIRKWVYSFTDDYLIFTKQGINIESYPAIKSYLHKFYKELKPRTGNEEKGRKAGSYNWYDIQDNTAYYPHFEKEKVVWGLTSDIWTFAYDDKNHYLPSNGYILTSTKISIKYILTILNSRLMRFYFGFIGIMTAGGAYTLKHGTILKFPIPEKIDSKPFEILVDCILFAKGNKLETEANTLESATDGMVYELYFEEEMKERKIDVLQFVEKDIEEVIQGGEFESLNNTQKEQAITELHTRWSDPDSEIVKRMNSFSEKSPEILKPILEG